MRARESRVQEGTRVASRASHWAEASRFQIPNACDSSRLSDKTAKVILAVDNPACGALELNQSGIAILTGLEIAHKVIDLSSAEYR